MLSNSLAGGPTDLRAFRNGDAPSVGPVENAARCRIIEGNGDANGLKMVDAGREIDGRRNLHMLPTDSQTPKRSVDIKSKQSIISKLRKYVG